MLLRLLLTAWTMCGLAGRIACKSRLAPLAERSLALQGSMNDIPPAVRVCGDVFVVSLSAHNLDHFRQKLDLEVSSMGSRLDTVMGAVSKCLRRGGVCYAASRWLRSLPP
jgi:hypothetical protein